MRIIFFLSKNLLVSKNVDEKNVKNDDIGKLLANLLKFKKKTILVKQIILTKSKKLKNYQIFIKSQKTIFDKTKILANIIININIKATRYFIFNARIKFT